MSRYIGPVCRLCRREGVKLFLKGQKCFTKCIFEKRKEIPGQHGKARAKKMSEYAKRLREKQKLRRMAGVSERPFRRYFRLASIQKGMTGVNLLRLLEMRLDNVVHRLGLALSKPAARQMILHGHILVNGKCVNVPSYPLKPGDAFSLKTRSQEVEKYKKWWEQSQQTVNVPGWLDRDVSKYGGQIKSWPMREEISFPINEQLIVELYSK